ncbi:MAG: competence type IV pilus minor pilin ComGG [Vagococcus sp.]
MKRKPIVTFSFRGNQGGILFPVMAILLMMTLLLVYVTDDYFARREMLVNTRDYYVSRSMEEMSLETVRQDTEAAEVVVSFNQGKSRWKKGDNLADYQVITSLSNQYKRTSHRNLTTKR